MGAMKVILCSALVIVGFSAIAEAGGYGYGNRVTGVGAYYQPRQQVYAYYQPARVQYYTPGVVGGYNAGLSGGSGNALGSVLPLLLIFLLLAIFAPLLIGSLVFSNDVVYSNSK